MATGTKGIILFFLIVLAGPLLYSQQRTYQPGEYPAPRYPTVPQKPTVEDLMPTARSIVKRGDIGAMFYPGYAIKPGERALMAVPRDFDQLVLEALSRAIREEGAKIDLILGNEPYLPGGDGATEFEYFTQMKDIMAAQAGGIEQATIVAMTLAGKYDIAISGMGGGIPPHPRDKMRWAYMPWDMADQFLVHGSSIPPELLKFIDDVAWDTLTQAVHIHAVDPEGTDISWSTTPEDWQSPGRHTPGHFMSHPLIDLQGIPGATGVVGGTWNHTGPHPHIRLSFNNDRLEGIEGGGAYGQKWRGIRDQWRDVEWPGKKGPGLFNYLFEASVGTNPKSARPKKVLERAMGNIWERTRAGVIHWGIGGDAKMIDFFPSDSSDPAVANYFQENPDTPTGHVHVHNYFLTMVLTNADGSKTTFVDKGHMTALDDPRVRQEAAKYGDPDELLRENWIPAIPGINVPGDYRRDYASDPSAWIRKDLETNWKY